MTFCDFSVQMRLCGFSWGVVDGWETRERRLFLFYWLFFINMFSLNRELDACSRSKQLLSPSPMLGIPQTNRDIFCRTFMSAIAAVLSITRALCYCVCVVTGNIYRGRPKCLLVIFKSRGRHITSRTPVNQLITRRIRPVRAFAAGRNDLRRDEESQHELPTSAPDPKLQRTSSIHEIFHSHSQEDHAPEEKGEVGIVHDIVEESPCVSPAVPAGQVARQKNVFWVFKNVKPKTPFTFEGQMKYILLHSWLMNLVMPCCAVGLVLYQTSGKSTASFVVNFLATLPANFLGNLAMTEIGLRIGPLLADWMSMTTG
ncbi:hypothetical protein J3459_006103 [Metarhizium acridum]|nr:hypothetical protein J3459_006103 [Metarhizium acridum]